MRIGFDVDGVLADLSSAYREVEARLFGPEEIEDDVPETPDEKARLTTSAKATVVEKTKIAAAELRALERKRELVWRAIEATDNFWTTLKPLDRRAPARIQTLALRHRWEIFFITQRPDTAGDSVQHQTQRWLAAHGFDLPSVIVARDSRGKVAAALHLDYLVDDTAKNCVDAIAESKTRPILVARHAARPIQANARALGIGVAGSIGEALDLLEQAQGAQDDPKLWKRLAHSVGWK